MIHFYRSKESPAAEALEERLKNLAVAYKRHLQEDDEKDMVPSSVTQLPAFVEGKTVVSGVARCREFVEKLEKEVVLWRKFQSDACYLDDDGKVC